jgi:hypothetical protein
MKFPFHLQRSSRAQPRGLDSINKLRQLKGDDCLLRSPSIESIAYFCSMHSMRITIIIIAILLTSSVKAQPDSLAAVVLLDAFVIQASTEDFDVTDFIEQVKSDTSYVKAFANMRYYAHRSTGDITVYNRREKEKGRMSRKANHLVKNRYYWIDITAEATNGKIKNRKGEYKYYTAEMFDHAFYPADTLLASNSIAGYRAPDDAEGKKQQHKNDIKVMMFNPGAEISGIPIVGKKMAIFDDDMVPYYDYRIWQYNYQDTIPCYAFTCTAKPEFPKDKTVVKDLTSYFNVETMQVMKREYHMKYNSLLFAFDVHIDVELESVNDALVPVSIAYSGFWDVAIKKAEHISFNVVCSGYRVL